MVVLEGFDTDTNLTEDIIVTAVAAGQGRFGRYLKNLTATEVVLCAKHGAGLWLIAEGMGDLATMEQGASRGQTDGAAAAKMATALGVPEGTMIFAAVDFGAIGMTQIEEVDTYMGGFAIGCAPYQRGIYGDGDVLSSLTAKGYVAGADGWPGTGALLANPSPNIALVQHAPTQMFGIEVDPVDVLDESVLWFPQAPAPVVAAVPAVLPASKTALQAALGIKTDGIWGPVSEAALDSYVAQLPA
jgi:Domain of unknown function (DUF1906)